MLEPSVLIERTRKMIGDIAKISEGKVVVKRGA